MTPRVLLVFAWIAGCSASVAPASPSFAPDPDTEPLPPAPKAEIPDPRSPALQVPTEASHPPDASAETTAEAKPDAKPDVKPDVRPRASPAAQAASPSSPAACGSRENPCPMQKLMRSIGTASSPEALEAAFNRIASVSPNAGWQWASIARKGAELAKSGDTVAAKKQCKVCHDQYRDVYRTQYRGKK